MLSVRMADKIQEKIAEESFKEGQKAASAASARAELAHYKKENETLAKVKNQLERGYNRALEQPNKIQLGIAVSTAGVGVMVGFKGNQILEKKTSTWIDEKTGEQTMAGKVVQHGVVPAVGLGLAVVGAFVKSGPASAAIMGLGAGIAAGSVVRSALTPAPAAP